MEKQYLVQLKLLGQLTPSEARMTVMAHAIRSEGAVVTLVDDNDSIVFAVALSDLVYIIESPSKPSL